MSKSLDARLDALEAYRGPAPKTAEEMDYWELLFALKHGRAPRSEAERASVETMTEAEQEALIAAVEAELKTPCPT